MAPKSRRTRGINPSSPRSAAAARQRRYYAIREAEREGNPPEDRISILCYDAASGTLAGDSASPFFGLQVELVELFENSKTVLVRNSRLPNGELVAPLCSDRVARAAVTASRAFSTPSRALAEEGCCIDEVTGVISCPGGKAQSNLHGVAVPLVAMGCYDAPDGSRMCTFSAGGDNTDTLPVCPTPPEQKIPPSGTVPPPECCVDEATGVVSCPDPDAQIKGIKLDGFQIPTGTWGCFDAPDGTRTCRINVGGDDVWEFPACPTPSQQCCYDVASGRLRCNADGVLDGLDVSLVSMGPQADGSVVAVVQHPDLGTVSFPICDDQVVDCCYDSTTEKLVCGDSELDGTAAGIVASWTDPSGQIYVWAAWQGGAARMPLCPGIEECPPAFCCVNMQTMEYVCPGVSDLNGKEAPIVEVVSDGGFNFGVLDDGTRIPLCGKDCPPPQLCPDCPTCPPGQWLSPDGTCHEPPECPPEDEPCPPGQWRNPTGACVDPPQCPTCPECPGCPRCPPQDQCCPQCGRDPCGHRRRAGGHRRARIGGGVVNPGEYGVRMQQRGGSSLRAKSATRRAVADLHHAASLPSGEEVFTVAPGAVKGKCPTGEECSEACLCSGVSKSGIVGVGATCKCMKWADLFPLARSATRVADGYAYRTRSARGLVNPESSVGPRKRRILSGN